MSQILEKVYLLDIKNNSPSEAYLITDLEPDRLETIQALWQSEFRRFWEEALKRGISENKLPEHKNWNWVQKVQWATSERLVCDLYAIEHKGVIEGLFMTSQGRTARLPSQKGKPLLYVDYLSSAPWNLEPLCEQARYRNIGTVFMKVAFAFSKNLGYYGRVGLHSLVQSEDFYRRLQMIDLGPDAQEENLRYFEVETSE